MSDTIDAVGDCTEEMIDNQVVEPVTLDLRQALGLVDDDLLVPGVPDDHRVGVSIEVNGEAVDPSWGVARRTPCLHAGKVNVNTLSANVLGERGEVLSRQLRVRVRCSECGHRLVPELEGTFPRDGIPGIVLYLSPAEGGDYPMPADPAAEPSAPVT